MSNLAGNVESSLSQWLTSAASVGRMGVGASAIRKALSTQESETPLVGKRSVALPSAGDSKKGADDETIIQPEKGSEEDANVLVVQSRGQRSALGPRELTPSLSQGHMH